MAESRKLKCRYCDWTTLAWYTTKNGNNHRGINRLVEHVRENHTPTYLLTEMLENERLDLENNR